MPKKPPKLIVILGPTSSGKTDLSLKLAKKFNGEIVSADSRQVYRGLDLLSGKATRQEQKIVPHHLLNVANLRRQFTVSQYQQLAHKAVNDIQQRGKTAFLVGGTGLYIDTICNNFVMPEVRPDRLLRQKLNRLSLQQLQKKYRELDPLGFTKIDQLNPRRLIRAIEVVLATKKPFFSQQEKRPAMYRCLKIGLRLPPETLKQRIDNRLEQRLKTGMLTELKKLRQQGASFKRLKSLGLESRYLALYLEGELPYQEMKEKLRREIYQFAKRQMTWFKRDRSIRWVESKKEAERLINDFLQ